MIEIDKLKKGDVFYKAQMTGILECTMEDDEIQKYGSFSVTIKERGDKLGMISKEDYEYLFYTREEAEEAKKTLPNDDVEKLLDGDTWIENLFYVYKTYMPDSYIEPMKKAIETKMDIELD